MDFSRSQSRLTSRRVASSCCLLVASLLLAPQLQTKAFALGEEGFGNKPFSNANYKDWPGVLPVLNHKGRVYHRWVNGNEDFYFQGDAGALNEALENFANVESDNKRVVILADAGNTKSFDGKREFPYDWKVHLCGGIARAFSTRHNDPPIHDLGPTLTIRVGGKVKLQDIRVPATLQLESIDDLRDRYYLGLKKGDNQVSGYAAVYLSEVDPHSPKSADRIGALVKSGTNEWTLRCALSSLARMKTVSKEVKTTVSSFETTDDNVQKDLDKAITALSDLEVSKDTDKARVKSEKEISDFVKKHAKKNE